MRKISGFFLVILFFSVSLSVEYPVAAFPAPLKIAQSAWMKVCAGRLGELGFGAVCKGYYLGKTAEGKDKLISIDLPGVTYKEKIDKIKNLLHTGIDIAAPKGTAVYSIADGVVADVIDGSGDPNYETLGNMVIVKHASGGHWSIYCHLNSVSSGIRPGKQVKAGVGALGGVGNTGAAYGSKGGYHLHLEVRNFEGRFFPAWENGERPNIYGIATDKMSIQGLQEKLNQNWVNPQKN